MNRNQSKGRFIVAIIVTLVTMCFVSTAAFATNYTAGSSSSATQSKTPKTNTSTSDDTDDSEILSSQNWEELLNTSSATSQSSETASQSTALGSPLGSGIGQNSVFIWGCFAVGLGVLGIAFFIYSQFIYKHMKKRGVAKNTALEEHKHQPKETMPKRGNFYKEQTNYAQTRQEEQPQKENEEPSKSHASSKTDEIDWDKFFDDHKNQSDKDE